MLLLYPAFELRSDGECVPLAGNVDGGMAFRVALLGALLGGIGVAFPWSSGELGKTAVIVK